MERAARALGKKLRIQLTCPRRPSPGSSEHRARATGHSADPCLLSVPGLRVDELACPGHLRHGIPRAPDGSELAKCCLAAGPVESWRRRRGAILLCGCEARVAMWFRAEGFGASPGLLGSPPSVSGYCSATVWARHRRRCLRACSPVSSARLLNQPPRQRRRHPADAAWSSSLVAELHGHLMRGAPDGPVEPPELQA